MRVRREIAGVVVVTAAIALGAAPAAAHGTSGPEATNYETRVHEISPETRGLSVRAVDLGETLELRNTTGTDVVVLGYQDEPYLRVGPDGVFENRRSPAAYLNESPDDEDVRLPEIADPEAPPEWHRLGGGDTARWHEHRAHWMASQDPPAVRRDPGSRHVVQPWTVELRRDGETIEVTGDVVWVPGPSPWPWLLVALGLAVTVVVASRLRHWPAVFAVALAGAMGATAAHLAGEWGATTASVASTLGSGIYAIGAVGLGAVALVLLIARDDPSDATPAVLIAGLVLALGAGLADIGSLWHSQLASTQATVFVRLEVSAALGLGLGLAAAAALRLRRAPLPARAGPVGAGTGERRATSELAR
ncbi:MAG: hypothetical protein ACRDY6_11295 [Acidimicrobiia bacterium]